MSIPDRFYRIAKHKLGEMKDWFDKVDENDLDLHTDLHTDLQTDLQNNRQKNQRDASRELNDTLVPSGNPASLSSANSSTSSASLNSPSNRVPPPASSSYPSSPSHPNYPTGNSIGSRTNNNIGNNVAPVDPLDYHYRLLSLEPGADFPAVQAAYNRLAARCDPALFPAGSAEERQARQIRERLDTSYKQLRDVLDITTTRFGRLEF